jgi:hypothetical protein
MDADHLRGLFYFFLARVTVSIGDVIFEGARKDIWRLLDIADVASEPA